jgi:glucose dehydrogenase
MVYPAAGFAQKAPDLRKPAGKEWLTIGGDWHNTRYSTLTRINRNNVKNLKGAWVTHLGSRLGQKYSFEGTPIVKDGILYIATGNDDVYALDGKTGALVWEGISGQIISRRSSPMTRRVQLYDLLVIDGNIIELLADTRGRYGPGLAVRGKFAD